MKNNEILKTFDQVRKRLEVFEEDQAAAEKLTNSTET